MRCRVDGCKTSARPGGLCIAHGGGQCRVEGCRTGARSRGMCLLHQRIEQIRSKKAETARPKIANEVWTSSIPKENQPPVMSPDILNASEAFSPHVDFDLPFPTSWTHYPLPAERLFPFPEHALGNCDNPLGISMHDLTQVPEPIEIKVEAPDELKGFIGRALPEPVI